MDNLHNITKPIEIPLVTKSIELYKIFYQYLELFPKKDKYALGAKCEKYLLETLELFLAAGGAPLLDKKARSVRRFIFSNSVVVPFDKQSRIVIPPFLIDYAGLSKEIIVVGSGDHFEIWDSLKWQKEWERLESIDE